MSVRRWMLTLPMAVAVTFANRLEAAAQSTGFVHLKTHIVGAVGDRDLGVYRTFVQGANGRVETFSQEFVPGSHTFAEVEAIDRNCRATAQNVTFTITAGQWTDVDVPVTYVDCTVGINLWGSNGIGTISYFVVGNVGGLPIATCQTVYDQSGHVILTNFHSCAGTIPYGSTVTVTNTPSGAKMCCSPTASFAATEPTSAPYFDFSIRSYSFADTAAGAPPAPAWSFTTDLSIAQISGTAGGKVYTGTYQVVNHGPNPAYRVQLLGYPGNRQDTTLGIETERASEGYCPDGTPNDCIVNILPPGDSTTFFIRLSGVEGTMPVDSEQTNSSPCVIVRSYGNNDPNPTNNTVACSASSVPVTVTLGGATPANQTVQVGALTVPTLEFTVNPATQQTINTVTVQAHGTGNDQTDITAVNLYVDANGNGKVDAGDSLIATSTFAANDGSATLNVSPLYSISTPTKFLVTYSFSLTVAQRFGVGLALAMFPLFLIPVVRRRRNWSAAVVALLITTFALTSCGGDSSTGPPANGSVTFQATLTNVNVSGTDVANLSLTGATITVNK